MPDYLLFAAYGLLGLCIVVCLAIIAKTYDDDDIAPEQLDRDH
jgi:hypothetical protein